MTIRYLEIKDVKCVPAKEFFFVPDFASTILWYDEVGVPKKYVPSKQLPNGEWSYCLSPLRDNPALKGEALLRHAELIKELKHG